MAYNTELAARVRAALADQQALSELKMFGGLAFMLSEHMCCGLLGDELIVRVGPEQYHAALAHPEVREFDFTGRPMTGLVLVSPRGTADDSDLQRWVERGVAFAGTLPPKGGASTPKRRRAAAQSVD